MWFVQFMNIDWVAAMALKACGTLIDSHPLVGSVNMLISTFVWLNCTTEVTVVQCAYCYSYFYVFIFTATAETPESSGTNPAKKRRADASNTGNILWVF